MPTGATIKPNPAPVTTRPGTNNHTLVAGGYRESGCGSEDPEPGRHDDRTDLQHQSSDPGRQDGDAVLGHDGGRDPEQDATITPARPTDQPTRPAR